MGKLLDKLFNIQREETEGSTLSTAAKLNLVAEEGNPAAGLNEALQQKTSPAASAAAQPAPAPAEQTSRVLNLLTGKTPEEESAAPAEPAPTQEVNPNLLFSATSPFQKREIDMHVYGPAEAVVMCYEFREDDEGYLPVSLFRKIMSDRDGETPDKIDQYIRQKLGENPDAPEKNEFHQAIYELDLIALYCALGGDPDNMDQLLLYANLLSDCMGRKVGGDTFARSVFKQAKYVDGLKGNQTKRAEAAKKAAEEAKAQAEAAAKAKAAEKAAEQAKTPEPVAVPVQPIAAAPQVDYTRLKGKSAEQRFMFMSAMASDYTSMDSFSKQEFNYALIDYGSDFTPEQSKEIRSLMRTPPVYPPYPYPSAPYSMPTPPAGGDPFAPPTAD